MNSLLYTSLSRRRLLQSALLAAALPLSVQAQPPRRVVSLFQGATDSLVALGITPCGIVESWAEKPVYRYLRPALQHVPLVGLETQPSLEDIVLLQPDLIVASRFRHQEIASLMQQIAPVVMTDDVFDFKRTLSALASSLQQQARAAALLQQWQQRIAGLKSALQQRFTRQWPLQVSVIEVRPDHIRSYVAGSFPGAVLSELGFAWNDAARQTRSPSLRFTNMESLPVLNADIFFVLLRAQSPAIERQYQRLQQHPLWQRMRAVQNGFVWQVDSVPWSLSGGILGADLMLDDIERHLISEQPA